MTWPGPPPGGRPTARAVVRLSSETAETTRAIGARLGRLARPGDVFAFYGDLGAGKTCLIQGLAEGLEIAGPVTSPTFVLIAEHTGRLPLYHVDLYRARSLDEIEALGLEELLRGEGITAIEWAEKAEALLPGNTVRIRVRGLGDATRDIELEGLPPDWPEGLSTRR